MAPILLIKYAVAGCTAEQVTQIFTQKFGNVVDRVVTLNKINFTTGAPFHMFFIHLNPDNTTDLLNAFLAGFVEKQVQRINYNPAWYWNVVVAEPRTKRVPESK